MRRPNLDRMRRVNRAARIQASINRMHAHARVAAYPATVTFIDETTHFNPAAPLLADLTRALDRGTRRPTSTADRFRLDQWVNVPTAAEIAAHEPPTAPQSADQGSSDRPDPDDPDEPAYAAGDQVDVYPATMRETCRSCGLATGDPMPGYVVVPAASCHTRDDT